GGPTSGCAGARAPEPGSLISGWSRGPGEPGRSAAEGTSDGRPGGAARLASVAAGPAGSTGSGPRRPGGSSSRPPAGERTLSITISKVTCVPIAFQISTAIGKGVKQ